MKFGTGDVVRLKSGGSKMTVNSVSDDTVFVMWFNEEDKFESRNLSADTLDMVTPLTVERKGDKN